MQTSNSTHDLSQEFHDFVADMETLLKQTANLTGEELSNAQEKLRKRVASAKSSVTHIGGEIADDAQKVAAKVNRQVHAKPWKAIGAVAAVSVLAGVFFATR